MQHYLYYNFYFTENSYTMGPGWRRTVLKSSCKPEEEVPRKPEKKKNEFQTSRQELTVGLGKGKIREEKVRSIIKTF